MKSFTQHLMEFDYPQIYCDMDGVVADFTTYTTDRLGHPFSDDDWDDLPVDFFLQLPPMADAHILWNFIKQYDPFMLTAIPREERGPVARRAWKDKTRWMMKHFRLPKDRMRIVLRKNKKKFAKDGRDGRPNLLIDDHLGNVKLFIAACGIVVHHIDARTTITKLKKI